MRHKGKLRWAIVMGMQSLHLFCLIVQLTRMWEAGHWARSDNGLADEIS
jgi:hypothetical protein